MSLLVDKKVLLGALAVLYGELFAVKMQSSSLHDYSKTTKKKKGGRPKLHSAPCCVSRYCESLILSVCFMYTHFIGTWSGY